MFEKLLDTAVLNETLLNGTLCLFPPMEDRAAWAQVAGEEITALAEEYRGIPYPMRHATDFMAFVRDGSRKKDENPYFQRRRKLCIAVLNCCITGSLEDLDAVVDGLWCICEETSWVISAHNRPLPPKGESAARYPLPDPDEPFVDLFSAQTGMILALVCSLMPEALDAVTPMLRQRVQREIRRRILVPFMAHDDFWWMGFVRKNLNNWTPWIVSNIMLIAALCVQDKAERLALVERALPMVDRWLDCIPEDGGCDEGAGYWNMAGGALLDILELLEKMTGGRITFWQDEKVRNILRFPAKVSLGGGWFANFADCDARPGMAGERLQAAGERIQDAALAALGVSMRGSIRGQLDDTPQMWRVLNMLFHPAGAVEKQQPEARDVWMPNLQLRIREDEGFLLCCKGGHNDESHNHNDVGSFMLYVDGKPVLVDAGNMVYTAKTFSAQRYTLWNTRAAYHNLPIIGGCEQQPGKDYAARDVQPTANGMRLDMAATYDRTAGIASACRHISVRDGAMRLRDEITLEQPQAVCWVFMLREKPLLSRGVLYTGEVRLLFDPRLTAAVEEIPVTDPRMAGSYPGSLWRVTVNAEAAVHHDQTFRVERN